MDAHERFEELAVGHVLGGLDTSDAADFRTHLLGCRDCRLRVAELRDIAADLAAAEREERAEARVRTEVPQRTERDDEVDAARRRSSRTLGVAVAAAAVLIGALAFWNLHLRTQVAATSVLAERQQEALVELATGVVVAVEVAAPTEGRVVVDDDDVAFSFVELPALAASERYVVWLTGVDANDANDGNGEVALEGSEDVDGADGDGVDQVLVVRSSDRRVAGVAGLRGADRLLVTVEEGPVDEEVSTARAVATADLTAGLAPDR